MGIVFINYRRDDTAGEARALYSDLVEQLGSERVFMDVDNIALGHDFREVLRQRLDDCELMLTLIGRTWLEARDADGVRRLEQPGDFVRLEIATALERKIPVTPVLLQDARMPPADRLTEDLKGLAFRNGFEISHATWDSNVKELVRRLGLPPATPAPAPTQRSKAPLVLGVGAVVLAAAVGAWYATWSAPAPAVNDSNVRGLVAQLTGPDKDARQAAAERLEREFRGSTEAVRAGAAQLEWDRFRALDGAAPRAQLLRFLLASDEAAWTPELRTQASRSIRVLRERIAAGDTSFRPEIVARIEELAKRIGA